MKVKLNLEFLIPEIDTLNLSIPVYFEAWNLFRLVFLSGRARSTGGGGSHTHVCNLDLCWSPARKTNMPHIRVKKEDAIY